MRNQQEIWREHTRDILLEDVIHQFNNPCVFQMELKEEINKVCKENCFEKIIEVGCETGVTSMLLDDKLDKTYFDLNPKAIELCEAACKKLNKNGKFIVGDMFEFNFEDKTFDLVFNSGVIEHFTEKERIRLLKEYSRVLKDKGLLIIAFPNHYSFPYRSAYLVRKITRKWPYPKEYKILNLNREIRKNNLCLVERKTISKNSVFNWWDFFKPIKYVLGNIDEKLSFEGYLTMLIIKKME